MIERIFDGFTLLVFLVGGLSFLRPSRALLVGGGAHVRLYVVVLVSLVALRTGHGLGILTAVLARLPTRVSTRGAAPRVLPDGARRSGGRAGPRGNRAALDRHLGRQRRGVEAVFQAFSLDLPIYASFLLLGVIAVALVPPSAPGYIGPFQAGTVQGLALLGVSQETALSLSIVYHLCNYIPITIVGPGLPERPQSHLGELRSAGSKSV